MSKDTKATFLGTLVPLGVFGAAYGYQKYKNKDADKFIKEHNARADSLNWEIKHGKYDHWGNSSNTKVYLVPKGKVNSVTAASKYPGRKTLTMDQYMSGKAFSPGNPHASFHGAHSQINRKSNSAYYMRRQNGKQIRVKKGRRGKK